MNNNNLAQLMTQTKNYQAHRKKISAIMNKGPALSFDNRRIKVINTFYSNKDKAVRYTHKNKQQIVQKQNDLILKKIIEVNNRRNGSMQNVKTTRSSSHTNLVNLKKSMQTINQQNQKIAQKLVTTNSLLGQQKMSESYKKHLERKERLAKYEYDEEVGMVIPKKIKSLQKFRTLEQMRVDQSSKYGQFSRMMYVENEQK